MARLLVVVDRRIHSSLISTSGLITFFAFGLAVVVFIFGMLVLVAHTHARLNVAANACMVPRAPAPQLSLLRAHASTSSRKAMRWSMIAPTRSIFSSTLTATFSPLSMCVPTFTLPNVPSPTVLLSK